MVTVRLLSIVGLVGMPRQGDDKPPGLKSAREQPDRGDARITQTGFLVDGCRVREALLNVEEIAPELKGKLVRPDGSLNPALFCVIEGQPAKQVYMDTPLGPDSVLLVAPVITGG
ncbi:MAG: hypothetical protein ACOYW4_06700 [Bacillota bacterium]